MRVVVLALAVLAACARGGGPDHAAEEASPPVADTFPTPSFADVPGDLETLGYEIADLQTFFEANPAAKAGGSDPAADLARAREARDAAAAALAAGDTAAAADRLVEAARAVDAAKRGLGFAEEWSEPVEPDTAPAGAD